MERKNLDAELLKKILNDEVRTITKKNLIKGKKFSEMLNNAIKKYKNKLISATHMIQLLIDIAKEIRESIKHGESLELSEEELAFYDALADNDSAKAVLGNETLREIAQILVREVRKNTTIDWLIKENIRAKLRLTVKKILRKYGYPPDKEKLATENILKQAELFAGEWSN